MVRGWKMNKVLTPKNIGHPGLYQYQSSFPFPIPEKHNEWDKMSQSSLEIL
jgi:hypothetical protein